MKEKSKGRWSRDGLSKVESKRSMMISFQSILSSRWSRELQSIRCIQLAWMRRTLFQYLILRLIQVGRGEADLSLFLEASREDSATDLRLMDFAVLYSESFLNSWSKVVISLLGMVLGESPSMEKNSKVSSKSSKRGFGQDLSKLKRLFLFSIFRWELRPQAYRTIPIINGKRRTRNQWFSILHHNSSNPPSRWKTRSLR